MLRLLVQAETLRCRLERLLLASVLGLEAVGNWGSLAGLAAEWGHLRLRAWEVSLSWPGLFVPLLHALDGGIVATLGRFFILMQVLWGAPLLVPALPELSPEVRELSAELRVCWTPLPEALSFCTCVACRRRVQDGIDVVQLLGPPCRRALGTGRSPPGPAAIGVTGPVLSGPFGPGSRAGARQGPLGPAGRASMDWAAQRSWLLRHAWRAARGLCRRCNCTRRSCVVRSRKPPLADDQRGTKDATTGLYCTQGRVAELPPAAHLARRKRSSSPGAPRFASLTSTTSHGSTHPNFIPCA